MPRRDLLLLAFVQMRLPWRFTTRYRPCSTQVLKDFLLTFNPQRPGWQWIGSRWRMPAQTWTHVVVVYDSTYEQACTYANGRLVSTQQVKGKLKGSTQPLLIGVELKVRSSPALEVLLFLSALRCRADRTTYSRAHNSQTREHERASRVSSRTSRCGSTPSRPTRSTSTCQAPSLAPSAASSDTGP